MVITLPLANLGLLHRMKDVHLQVGTLNHNNNNNNNNNNRQTTTLDTALPLPSTSETEWPNPRTKLNTPHSRTWRVAELGGTPNVADCPPGGPKEAQEADHPHHAKKPHDAQEGHEATLRRKSWCRRIWLKLGVAGGWASRPSCVGHFRCGS